MSSTSAMISGLIQRDIINGNEEFRGAELKSRVCGEPQADSLYLFVTDGIVPNSDPNTFKICEIQPALTSVLPDDVKNSMVTHLENKLPSSGEIIYVRPVYSLIVHSVALNKEKVRTLCQNHLDGAEVNEQSIVLFAGDDILWEVNEQKVFLRERTSLVVDPVNDLFTNKLLQRIVISMFAPELNPSVWHAFSKDNPPTIMDIKEKFPHGYIIKANCGTRGEKVSAIDFKSDAELQHFLNQTDNELFIIEEFVHGTKTYEDKSYAAQRRLYCASSQGETTVLGAQDTLAPVAIDGSVEDANLTRVCHSKGEFKQTNIRPSEDEILTSEMTDMHLNQLMLGIDSLNHLELLKVLLEHPNPVYQKLASAIILNVKNHYHCFNSLCTLEYMKLIHEYAKVITCSATDKDLEKLRSNINAVIQRLDNNVFKSTFESKLQEWGIENIHEMGVQIIQQVDEVLGNSKIQGAELPDKKNIDFDNMATADQFGGPNFFLKK